MRLIGCLPIWGLALLAAGALDAQQPKPNVSQLRANMLDIVVRADTVFGVEVGVSPNWLSVEGRRRSELRWFAFDPALVEQWTLHTGPASRRPPAFPIQPPA